MEFHNLNPHLRYFDKVKLYLSYPQFLKAYDYRLFFTLSGSFSIKLEKQTIVLTRNDLLIIPPGTAYKLVLEKGKDASYYILNFDLDNLAETEKPKPPVPIKYFNPKDIFSTLKIPPFESVFILKNAVFAEELLGEIETWSAMQPSQSKHIKTALLKYLLIKCIFHQKNTETMSLTKKIIEQAKEYIRENISSCPSNKAIAKAVGYHAYYLNSLFVDHEHITLHKYMDNIRLKKAKDLLLSSNAPVHEVAEMSGFPDASYFSRMFKKNVGLTPKQYRELSK